MVSLVCHLLQLQNVLLPLNMSALVFVSIKQLSGTFFSESPLNTDTWIIRTLGRVPLVSVLPGFHCIRQPLHFSLSKMLLVKHFVDISVYLFKLVCF